MFLGQTTVSKGQQFCAYMEAFWAKGSKKFMHPLAEGLVEKGYVAVCSNYRLTDVAPAPAQLHDVFSAIRFLRKNASDYGIDPEKIGVPVLLPVDILLLWQLYLIQQIKEHDRMLRWEWELKRI